MFFPMLLELLASFFPLCQSSDGSIPNCLTKIFCSTVSLDYSHLCDSKKLLCIPDDIG
jgi:hypothetical protein